MTKKWELKLNGAAIRETIKTGDSFKTLEQLESTLKSFILTIRDEDMKFEFEDLYYLVESDVAEGEEGLEQFIEEEDGHENLAELVDDRLAEFYDLCDGYRVWITL